jgi:fatty acid desaturase
LAFPLADAPARIDNVRAAIKVALIVGGLAAALGFGGLATAGGSMAWLVLASVAAAIWTQHAIAEEIHDGFHQRVFSSIQANEIVSKIYASLIGISFSELRKAHLAHHRFFGTPDDPDYEKYESAPQGLAEWTKYFLYNFSGAAAVHRTFTGSQGSADTARKSARLLSQHPLGTAAVQATLLLIGAMLVHPLWYFFCWFVPLITISYGITQLRVMMEHWSPEPWYDPRTNEPRKGALYNLTGSVQRNLFGAQFGYNFHGTHHIHPAVPNYDLADYAGDAAMPAHLPIRSCSFFTRLLQVLRRAQ